MRRRRNENFSYTQQLHYFNYRFKDEQLMYDFENVIKHFLKPLFTQAENMRINIPVTYTDAKSIINPNGSYRLTLVNLINTFHMSSENQSNFKNYHQQVILTTILDESTSMQKLINLVKKYLERLSKVNYEWNVVYYGYYHEKTLLQWVN